MNLKNLLRSRFRDARQYRLFLMLFLAAVCCGLLVLGRVYMNRHELSHVNTLKDLYWFRAPTFVFLLWNLFLAWVPYIAALKVEHMQRTGNRRMAILPWLCLWLAFLPNAPYIITDFVHFRHLPPIPLWYDLTLFFASASLGLVLGLLSLYEVHGVLKKWFSRKTASLLVVLSIGLSGFGVWLGRFQRWNSWDIVTRPEALLRDIADTFTTRQELAHAAGISLLLSGVLLVGYGMLSIMLDGEENPENRRETL